MRSNKDSNADARERETSEKLIGRARDTLSSISLEEIVTALHYRFTYKWEWDAFKERLAASEKEPVGTKDTP